MRFRLRTLLKIRLPRSISLRFLFLALTTLAVLFAWYGARLRAIQRERERLAGTWLVINDERSNIAVPTEWSISFTGTDVVIYPPQGEIGYMDFQTANEPRPSPAIYRLEGDRIIFAQNSIKDWRPTEFNADTADAVWVVRRIDQP